MAVRDIATKLDNKIAMNEIIATDTTTTGAIIDTADFECGCMFVAMIPLFALGSAEFQVFESDDSGMAGAVAVPAAKMIGSLPTLLAADADNTTLAKFGVFSNLRYLRISCVSTLSADYTALVLAVQEGEFQPVDEA